MSEDVVQWLAEIQSLKQQLAEAIKERDEANASDAHWRNLYSTEAQQRRTEARLAQQKMEQLTVEIQQLQKGIEIPKSTVADTTEATKAIENELAQLETLEELKLKLIEVIQERDRLIKALKIEQEQHLETRNSLTAVISDTINQLAKVKGDRAK